MLNSKETRAVYVKIAVSLYKISDNICKFHFLRSFIFSYCFACLAPCGPFTGLFDFIAYIFPGAYAPGLYSVAAVGG
jgi:hypothetical protein